VSFFVVIGLIGLLLATEPGKVPIPGEVINNHSQKSDIQKNPGQNKNKDAPPLIKSDQKTSNNPAEQNKREAERITVSPIDVSSIKIGQLDIKRDWADRALVIFTGVLIVIGGLQWWATRAAAKSAKLSAQAADRQGDILVGIERPWIISIEPKLIWIKSPKPNLVKGPWPLPDQIDKPMDIRIFFRMVNVGNSPAFLNYFWRTAKPRPMPQPPELPEYGKSRFPPFVIPPQGEHGGELLMRNRSVEELQQIKAGQLVIIFWGKIRYESRIGKPETRTTKFCHVWGYDERGRDIYDPSGPEGWTDYD
jgi:hypothetical protein